MKISFFTLGCKVNQYETQALKNIFFEQGWLIVDNSSIADVYVINSCTVTSSGDRKARQAIHRFKRLNPESIIVLTGCLVQAFPNISENLPEVDIITGTSNRSKLPSLITDFLKSGNKIIDIKPHKNGDRFEDLTIKSFSDRTRAFIKIQDGCNRYCTYCIIPKARGFIRSKPIEKIKNEIELVAKNGYREIVLVGINLSSYGMDLKNVRLIDAVKTACSVDDIKRVRLSSLEPDLISQDDVIALSKEKKFCPQFHLSLQSGSNNVLKRMNRHYDTNTYKLIVDFIFNTFENPSITTDIMVGFPGETNEEFEESIKFVKEIGFLKTHIFPYSIRPGTIAAKMDGQISKSEKQKRVDIMENAAKEARKQYLKTQLNTTQQVLFERQKSNIATGYTKNYIKVKIKSSSNLCGQIKCVKIKSCEDDCCVGEISNS